MKRWIFYIGQFPSISEWHRLFLIRSGTDMTAIRYSEESGGDVILCWVWRMIVAIKYKCSRIYGETKPNVLTNHSGWSILCLRISLLMILHKRRISVTFSMSFNVNDYIYKNVVYAIHFFFLFCHFGHFIRNDRPKWKKVGNFSLLFLTHETMCTITSVNMLYAVYFSYAFDDIHNHLETVIYKLSFELINFSLLH